MKYRLKDRDLQRKLDAVSGGDFTERLQEGVSKIAPVVVLSFGESPHEGCKHRYMATFKHEEIEEIPRYDPTKWNDWPDVEPPYGVPLRVELVKRTGDETVVIERGCATYTPGTWKGMKIPSWTTGGIRFRPWDDDKEKKE